MRDRDRLRDRQFLWLTPYLNPYWESDQPNQRSTKGYSRPHFVVPWWGWSGPLCSTKSLVHRAKPKETSALTARFSRLTAYTAWIETARLYNIFNANAFCFRSPSNVIHFHHSLVYVGEISCLEIHNISGCQRSICINCLSTLFTCQNIVDNFR